MIEKYRLLQKLARNNGMFRHGIHMRPKSAKPQCMQQNVLKRHGSHPTSKCRSFAERKTSKLSLHIIAQSQSK